MKRKSLLTIGMAAVLMLSAAGCGKNPADTAGEQPAGNTKKNESTDNAEDTGSRGVHKNCLFLLDNGPDPGRRCQRICGGGDQ